MKYQGGISGSRASTEPSGLGPSGFDPGRSDFTIADVLAWARTKPDDLEYDFTDPNACAVAQFGLETARPNLVGLSSRELRAALDPALERAVIEVDKGGGWRRTFGGLVTRLEALCPETPVTKSDWLAIDAYMADIEQVSA